MYQKYPQYFNVGYIFDLVTYVYKIAVVSLTDQALTEMRTIGTLDFSNKSYDQLGVKAAAEYIE